MDNITKQVASLSPAKRALLELRLKQKSSEAKRHQSTGKRNPIQAESAKHKCITQLFETQVASTPDAVAVVFEDQQLTYRELNCRANQLAHHLTSLGVGPEVLVGICVERSLEMVVGLLGILKAGGAYVPLDPAYPQERLAFMLSDSQVSVLLTQEKLRVRLTEHGAHVVCLDADWGIISQEREENPVNSAKPKNLAYVIYTSGSTGKPKGVMIQHQSLVNFTETAIVEYGLTWRDRVLQFASISFDAAAEEIYPCLTCGGTLVLRSDEMLSDLPTFMQKCRDWELTVLDLPTAYWQQLTSELATAGLMFPESLRLVIIGGERALPERVGMWQKFIGARPQLVNTYGPTEATVVATMYKLPAAAPSETNLTEVPIGRALRHVRTYILDQHLQLLPIGVSGELYIGGAGLARGYLNRPDLTEEKFIPNPFSDEPGARLYKTGDLARYLSDGNIEFLGRIDHQVKIRGFRIELGEIEAVLSQHPEVRETVVIAREDQPGNKRLVAYVVSNQESPTASELRRFLKEKLPDYMVPSAFVMLDALPLTPNGKVDRRALPAPDTGLSQETSFVPPRTTTEKVIAEIWAEVLGLKLVGIHDNFFELGGHSLLVTQVISRLRSAFEVELPLRCLFEFPTIAGVAEAIDTIFQAGTPAANSTNSVTDLNAEAVLEPAIQPQALPVEYLSEPKSIFLTGATGFLGAYLLHELLQQTKADIYCLIRSPNADEGKQRLQSKLESYSLWSETFSSRIIPVVGDLSAALLGLSAPQFRHLASQIDVIYHNGAWVNFTYPYSVLKAANVLGTQEVLRLASEIKVKHTHFISTTSVFSSSAYSEVEVVTESDTLDHSQSIPGGYAQSKWVAEKLVMQARDRGLRVSIYRPARITGHSQTGVCNTGDFFSRMIKGCIQLGKAPNLDGMVDNITPVDYVSRAIVHLSRQKESLGKAFHLVNTRPIPLRDLVNFIRSLGYPLELISYDKWRAELSHHAESSSENALHPLLPIFPKEIPSLQERRLQFDCQNTLDGLADSDIVCSPVDPELIGTYFSYYTRSGFLHGPLLAEKAIHSS